MIVQGADGDLDESRKIKAIECQDGKTRKVSRGSEDNASPDQGLAEMVDA